MAKKTGAKSRGALRTDADMHFAMNAAVLAVVIAVMVIVFTMVRMLYSI